MSSINSTSEYLLLFRGTDWDRSLSPDQIQKAMGSFRSWFDRLTAEGLLKGAQPLKDDIRLISGKNGRTVADGPFAESKEAVGGYFLIVADSLEQATAIAQECPMLEHGVVVELRPVAAACEHLQRAEAAAAEAIGAA